MIPRNAPDIAEVHRKSTVFVDGIETWSLERVGYIHGLFTRIESAGDSSLVGKVGAASKVGAAADQLAAFRVVSGELPQPGDLLAHRDRLWTVVVVRDQKIILTC